MAADTLWQALLQQQLVVNNQCFEACILSKKNAVPWACSPGFIPRQYDATVTEDDGTEKRAKVNEAANLTAWIHDGKQPALGLRFNGEKYMVVREDASPENLLLNGRKGTTGICVATSGECVVVGTYSEAAGQQAASCFDAVQKVVEYLSRNDM